jgi:hypothetical protein
MITHNSNGNVATESTDSLLDHFTKNGISPKEFAALKPIQLRAMADLRDSEKFQPRTTDQPAYAWAVYIAGVLAADNIIHLEQGKDESFDNFRAAVDLLADLLQPILKSSDAYYPTAYIDIRTSSRW